MKCLNSLLEQEYKNYVVVLVDDGSSDGTGEYVKNNFPAVRIVRGTGDWWWTKSMNEGIKSILNESKKDDIILSLNNDLIVKPDYLTCLLKVYNKYGSCVVGSTSVWDSDHDKIAFIGVLWNNFNAKYKAVQESTLKYSELDKKKDIVESDLLPGRGTLYSVGLIDEVGFYDEVNFPQYIADEEFSLRAKKYGYKLLVSSEAVVYSDVENTGINFKHDKPSLAKFIESLKSIRSATNLKVRFKFAFKHGQIGLVYFLFDFTRIIGSFIKVVIKYYLGYCGK